MKTLIIFILLSSYVFGQEHRTDSLDLKPGDTYYNESTGIYYYQGKDSLYNLNEYRLESVDTAANRSPRLYSPFKEQLSELLQEYKKECYADTTRILRRLYNDYLFNDYNDYGAYKYDKKHYYLRKKPTFQGFIRWLND